MSASPSALQSTKRPLEDPSSPSGPNDQPEAKRPALDKVVKGNESETYTDAKAEPSAAPSATADGQGDTVVPDAPMVRVHPRRRSQFSRPRLMASALLLSPNSSAHKMNPAGFTFAL